MSAEVSFRIASQRCHDVFGDCTEFSSVTPLMRYSEEDEATGCFPDINV